MPHTEKDPANIAMIGRMIAAAGRKVGERDPDQLARLVALRGVLDSAIAEAMAGQRSTGITWESIGDALGVTRQAVIQSWGPKVKGAQ